MKVGVLMVGWGWVCPGARGCSENHDHVCQNPQPCIPGCYTAATELGGSLWEAGCPGLFCQHLWGDAPAAFGRGEPERARADVEPCEECDSRHGAALPSPTVLPGRNQPVLCSCLLQGLPTRPAAPPCTPSAPSVASTSWASAPSRTGCTSAPTPSPAQTSGTRPWLSPAAAPTPVSSPSEFSPHPHGGTHSLCASLGCPPGEGQLAVSQPGKKLSCRTRRSSRQGTLLCSRMAPSSLL